MEEEQSETKKKECVSVRYRTAVTENLKRFGKPRLEAAYVDREKQQNKLWNEEQNAGKS